MSTFTPLLHKAFCKASELPEVEQDALATLLLSELEESNFDRKLADSGAKLAPLAQSALDEFTRGQTKPLDECL